MKKYLPNTVFIFALQLCLLLSQLAIAKSPIYIDKSLKDFPIATNVSPNTFQLISHGRSGELLLNGQWKNAQQIADFLKPQIRNPKSEIRNLNIYGCEFAKGENGLQAVRYLEEKLNISVSASTNITGKDGDWILEVGKSNDVISVGNYKGNLQTCTVPVASGSNQPHINWDRNSTGYPGTMENNDFSPVVTKTGSNITAGSGLTMTNSGSAWGLTNLTATTLAAAKTANQYIQYIIPTTASGTSTYTLTHWTTFYASNAPANLAIEISTDPTFATSTLLYDGPDANTNNGLYFQTPLNQNYVLSNSTTYYVRLYPLGTGSKLLDSFGFNGTCSATNCGTAPTGATTTVCQTGTLAGTCTSPAVRTYYSDAALTTVVANPLTSTGTYYMACVSSTAPNYCQSAGVSFTVTAAPTAPTVTPASICSGQNTTLTGNCTTGTLTWFTADNTSLTTAKLASATVTPTVNTTYYAACIDGTCKSTSTPDLITVNALPAVPSATTAVAICNNGSSANLVGTCIAPAVTKWYTTDVAGGSVVVTPPVSPTATTTYYASCINNTTGCESATRRALTVTVNPLPVLTQTPTSSTICSGATFSTAVKSSLVGSYTATATVISGTATGATNIATTSLPTANTAVTYTSGAITNTGTTDAVVRYVFTPTATTGTCVGATVTQDVTIKPVVAAPTGISPITICTGTTTSLASAGSCATGTLTWYTTNTLTTLVATPTAVGAGSYYPACVDGSCKSAVGATEVVTAVAKPTTVPVVSGTASICSGASTSISSSSTCNSGTLTWYSDAALTTQVGTGSPLSVSPTTTTSYYASCVNGSCKGTASAAVPITVTNIPVITDVIAPICSNASNWFVAFTTSGTNTSTVTTSAGTLVPYSTRADGTSAWAVNSIPNATTSITVNVTENGCTTNKTYSRPADCPTVVPNALPVKILSFVGERNTEGIMLQWLVAEETGVQDFKVQKSTDAINFESVGRVVAQNIKDNHTYSYEDKSSSIGTVYYRLLALDFDGSIDYSKIIAVEDSGEQNAISVYPNPIEANGVFYLYLQSDADIKSYSMISNSGRKYAIKLEKLQEHYYKVDSSSEMNGSYILKIQTDKRNYQIRIVR